MALLNAASILSSVNLGERSVSAAENSSLAKCAMPTLQASFRDSKAVFSGRVLSERIEGDNKIFTIRLDRTWKGPKSRILEVRYLETMRYAAWMQVGETYFVYARGSENGILSDGRCSQTKLLSAAKEDLKLFGKGKPVK